MELGPLCSSYFHTVKVKRYSCHLGGKLFFLIGEGNNHKERAALLREWRVGTQREGLECCCVMA